MIRGCKVRIYPTKEQEQLIWKHIGACRYIWNWMLDYQQQMHECGGKRLSSFKMSGVLTSLKHNNEYKWLSEVSASSLQRVCKDLDDAYRSYFDGINDFPKRKTKKKSKPSYPLRQGYMYFEDTDVHVEKIGKVKYKTGFDIPYGKGFKFSNPRISNINGKWILSFGMECENQVPQLTNKSMGIDLGIKDLAIVAYGDEKIVFHNINKSKRMRQLTEQVKYTQRAMSRKYEANKQGNKYVKTNNIIKLEACLKKQYARIANIRLNYIHQTTHILVSKLPCRVVMEDLNVMGMMKNGHLAHAVQEQNFYEFRRQMQYKCERYGIPFILADRFYPSSKTCSCCGHIKRDLKLSDRTYVCSECGLTIDRDYNAAINLSKYVSH